MDFRELNLLQEDHILLQLDHLQDLLMVQTLNMGLLLESHLRLDMEGEEMH